MEENYAPKEFLDSTGTGILVEAIKDRPTKEEMRQAIDDAKLEGGDVDLSTYATKTELSDHTDDTDIHVTASDKTKWNGKQDAIEDLTTIRSNAEAVANKADTATVTTHTSNTDIHVATGEKDKWNNKQDKIDDLTNIRSNAANGNTAYGWGNHANADYVTKTEANGTYPTKSEMHKAIADAQLEGGDVDLDGFATKDELSAHTNDTTIHVTANDKTKWNGKQDAIEDLDTIRSNAEAVANKADTATVTAHTNDTTIHVTANDKTKWNGKQDAIEDLDTIRSNAANGNTAYGWGNHASAGYTKNTGTVTQVKVGSQTYDPSSGVVSLPAYPTVPSNIQELRKRIIMNPSSAGSSGTLSIDGSTYDVVAITLTDNVGGINLSPLPANGHEVTVLLAGGNTERTVAIVNNGLYFTPTGEDLEITVPANGYAEINFLNVASIIYVRAL